MQKLQLSGIYDEFAPSDYTIGCDLSNGVDSTIESVLKMQNGEATLVSFIEHIAGQPLTPWQERILISARQLGKTESNRLMFKATAGLMAQAGSQIASVFPEPSAWREFIETKGPVDDGVSWLFRKSLVSMAITQVLKS